MQLSKVDIPAMFPTSFEVVNKIGFTILIKRKNWAGYMLGRDGLVQVLTYC